MPLLVICYVNALVKYDTSKIMYSVLAYLTSYSNYVNTWGSEWTAWVFVKKLPLH